MSSISSLVFLFVCCFCSASHWSKPSGLKYESDGGPGIQDIMTILLGSKEAIKEVGMLDNRFFAYSEDTDYSLRILNSNHVTLYAPKAIIYHKVGHSSETNKGKWFAFYLATRNVIFLQKKHLSNLLFPLFIVSFGIRWVLYMSIKLTLLGDFKSIKGIYWGIVDGVFNRSRFYINNPFPNQKTFLRKEGREQS